MPASSVTYVSCATTAASVAQLPAASIPVSGVLRFAKIARTWNNRHGVNRPY